MTSDPCLKRWYAKFNREWFNGELPEDVDVFWAPCADDTANTRESDGVMLIAIDPCLMGMFRHAKCDLAHEMVHVKLWPQRHLADHGRKFDKEIQRLCQFRSYRKLL